MDSIRTHWIKSLTAALLLTGCGAVETSQPTEEVPGIEEFQQPLDAITSSYDATGKILTVPVADNQIVIVGRHPVSSAITVNNVATSASALTLKQLIVNGTGGANTVVIDFSYGTFAPGYGTVLAPTLGTTVDFGGGADVFKFRGSSTAVDTITFGPSDGADVNSAVAFNTDALPDMQIFQVGGSVAYTFSLGGGADVFNASTGARGTSIAGNTPASADVTVFGGVGADVLTGGDGNDTLNGDEDNDTLNAGAGTDTLNGGAGDDTLNAGSVTNGATVFNGGAHTVGDTVSYASRTIAVVVGVDAAAGDGQAGEGDTVGVTVEIVKGGSANDTFTSSGAILASQTFYGNGGTDTMDYSARTVAVTVTMGSNAANDGEALELDTVRDDIENVTCPTASVACTVTGNALDNKITVTNAATADVFAGGTGIDTIDYSAITTAMKISMEGEATMGDLSATTGGKMVSDDVENVLCPGTAACTIEGNGRANYILGSSAADTINGGAGDDIIETQAGLDLVTCGSGSDLWIDSGGSDTNVAADCE